MFIWTIWALRLHKTQQNRLLRFASLKCIKIPSTVISHANYARLIEALSTLRFEQPIRLLQNQHKKKIVHKIAVKGCGNSVIVTNGQSCTVDKQIGIKQPTCHEAVGDPWGIDGAGGLLGEGRNDAGLNYQDHSVGQDNEI